jgi:hypothetical protein
MSIEKAGMKQPTPFKFNRRWLVEEEFINLAKREWRSFDPDATRPAMF